ncbi:MAG: PD40 domain-containing protein [Thermoguttaceae bacterium]|nr:PD40 domain-containing protein [Thermoguttaceae bacterium]
MVRAFQRLRASRALFAALIVAVGVVVCRAIFSPTAPCDFVETDVPATIYPDYSGLVLPPNIAPLNFRLETPAERVVARISGAAGTPLVVPARGEGKIEIPVRRWKRLLAENVGEALTVEVFAKIQGEWTKFPPIVNRVCADPVDSHLYYRFIEPRFEFGNVLSLRRRNLETFDEEAFFCNESTGDRACMNCHNFQNYDAERFVFHYRDERTPELGGTFVVDGAKISKIDARLADGSPLTYPAYRPRGPFVAFSANKTRQTFHARDAKKIEVFDFFSELALLNVETREITQITRTKYDFETFPSWSPDGEWLYYSSARFTGFDEAVGADAREDSAVLDAVMMEKIQKFHYDLYRRKFDEKTASFGPPEKIIDAAALGKSVVHPRISSDGKLLVYSLCDYGAFPVWHKETDLWALDLQTLETRPLDEINSPEAETFHNWDSSGKWLVFSSRREDGRHTRLYLTHFDAAGVPSKPFVLPQRDPERNRDLFYSFNVPEFTKNPQKVDLRRLVKIAKQPSEKL